MDKLKRMALFARVVELGSFAAVAADQALGAAIVGRHVADLEQMLGLQLIRRTTRSMEVTEAGLRYYEGCKTVLEALSALEQGVGSEQEALDRGTIKIAAPDGLGSGWLMRAVAHYLAEHPGVHFDVLLDNHLTDPVAAGVDLSLRLVVTLDDAGFVARPLGQTNLSLYGAPAYLASHPGPCDSEAELRRHHTLCFSASRFGAGWPVLGPTGLRKLRLPWRLLANQTSAYREALLCGLGVGLMPELLAALWEERGELRRVPSRLQFPALTVYAVYPSARHLPARVKRFIEVLRAVY